MVIVIYCVNTYEFASLMATISGANECQSVGATNYCVCINTALLLKSKKLEKIVTITHYPLKKNHLLPLLLLITQKVMSRYNFYNFYFYYCYNFYFYDLTQ